MSRPPSPAHQIKGSQHRRAEEPRPLPMRPPPLRILQINLNRCRLAQDLMTQKACELNVDIVIISEPYRQVPEWHNDLSGDASIWATEFHGRFAAMGNPHRSQGIIRVTIEGRAVVSCYCPPPPK